MAHDGLARSIYPSHTPGDGDAIFVMATGERDGEVDLSRLGALAADAVARAVVRSVLTATSVEGIPAASIWSRNDGRPRIAVQPERAVQPE